MHIPLKNNDGFWTADYYFSLPAGFTKASLKITDCEADDRVVIELNGTQIANCGISAPGTGSMQMSDPGALVSYAFTDNYGSQDTKVKDGFVVGTNHLQIVVNNTGSGIYGPITSPSNANGDGTGTGLAGAIYYTAPATTAAGTPTLLRGFQ